MSQISSDAVIRVVGHSQCDWQPTIVHGHTVVLTQLPVARQSKMQISCASRDRDCRFAWMIEMGGEMLLRMSMSRQF